MDTRGGVLCKMNVLMCPERSTLSEVAVAERITCDQVMNIVDGEDYKVCSYHVNFNWNIKY